MKIRERVRLPVSISLLKPKEKQVEEMLILQIADKTNPQAGPMTVASLETLYREKNVFKRKSEEGRIRSGLSHSINGMEP